MSANCIHRVYSRLSLALKFRLLLCCIIAMLSSSLEIIAISSFYPLLTYLDSSGQQRLALPISQIPITITQLALLSILLVLFSGAIKVLYLIISNRLATNLAHYIASRALATVYEKPLQWHLSNGSKKLASIISFSDNISSGLFMPIMSSISACATIILIALLSLYASPLLFLASSLGLAAYYFVGYKLSSKLLKRNAQMIGQSNIGRLATLANSFESIREVKVFKAQNYFRYLFDSYDIPLRRAIANVAILSALPKFFLESALMIIIAIVILVMTTTTINAVSSLVLLILLAQKAVPAAQTLYSSLTIVKSNVPTIAQLLDASERLNNYSETNLVNSENQHLRANSPQLRQSLLSVRNLIASNDSITISVDNLDINLNQLVCVIGKSGSGKSTLIDALLGLSKVSGDISYKCNETSSPIELQYRASYSPQSASLPHLDINSIVGFADYCLDRPVDVERATFLLTKLGLTNLRSASTSPLQQETLSGGEKQRICIARALYPNRDLVVLDEPTNGLDPKSKRALLSTLLQEKEKRSILTVTHDMELIKLADQIYLMHDKRLISIHFSQVTSYISPNVY